MMGACYVIRVTNIKIQISLTMIKQNGFVVTKIGDVKNAKVYREKRDFL